MWKRYFVICYLSDHCPYKFVITELSLRSFVKDDRNDFQIVSPNFPLLILPHTC